MEKQTHEFNNFLQQYLYFLISSFKKSTCDFYKLRPFKYCFIFSRDRESTHEQTRPGFAFLDFVVPGIFII